MNSRNPQGKIVLLAVSAILIAAPAVFAQVNYTGYDFFAGPSDPRPNTNAAAANWTTAASGIGSIVVVDFENPPVPAPGPTTYVVLSLAPGVTLTASNPARPMQILDTPSESVANGYDTTAVGITRCSLVGPYVAGGLTYTFAFSFPIEAFGLNITGEGNTVGGGTMSLNYTDGSGAQVTPMAATIGARFAGFTDAGQAINSVTLTLPPSGGFSQPFISLDDVRWVRHDQVTPCMPDATGTGCIGECAIAGQICVIKEVVVEPNGFVHVTDCDCSDGDSQCHLVFDPASQNFSCAGFCPTAAEQCKLRSAFRPDGSIAYRCNCEDPTHSVDCQPVSQCNPNMPGTCQKVCTGDCPNGQICIPRRITLPADGSAPFISECDCGGSPNQCHPVVVNGGAIECAGQCPGGQPCNLVSHANADGSIDYKCCCPNIVGACCLPTPPPNCVVIGMCECFAQGGTFIGPNVPCTQETCQGTGGNTGACCIRTPDGGSICTITTAADCQFPNIYQGDGTSCVPNNPCIPQGACCLFDPAIGEYCQVMAQYLCENMGGTYLGDNTPCTPPPCPNQDPIGACCAQDDSGSILCIVVTAVQCGQIAGSHYYGDGSTCSPPPAGPPECHPDECGCEGECEDRPPNYTDPLFATFTGEVAVGTHFAFTGTGETVVNVFDVKNRASAPLNLHWTAATRYAHATWTADNLGDVFGVTLDKRGHIYVAATTCYSVDQTGPSGMGAVYKLDGTTGAISTFAVLPNTGPGLGNIAYDGPYDQFFVTNTEDGRIYRLSNSGVALSTFDHATNIIAAGGAPEAGDVPGFAPLGERVWAVDVYKSRVYYSLVVENGSSPSATASQSIWSIAQNATGDFVGVPQLEVNVPGGPYSTTYSNPVSDISFSRNACMLLSERSMFDNTSPNAHDARVREYRKIGGVWVPSSNTYGIGVFGTPVATNSAGGNDYDGEGRVYATGDALQFTPDIIYGIQSLPCGGGDVTNSALIDSNGILDGSDKTQVGDVEIACDTPCVKPPSAMTAWFPLDEATGVFADNIAGNPNGVYIGGPPSVPGMVNLAHAFDGVNDFVRVPNHAAINFGTGNFSIDLWIKTTAAQGVQVILDKRVPANLARGYAMFLFNGNLAFQLADNVHANYISTLFVADGQWHHVAVTIVRNSPTGLLLYRDGTSQSFNPTARSGSVTNASLLKIGGQLPSFGDTYINASIDEVQIFKRALLPDEVIAIYNAGRSGKCREACHAPTVVYCANQTIKAATMTICNYNATAQAYSWSLSGSVPGVGCTLSSPITFSPSSGIVNVPAGSCTSIPVINVNITRPAGLTPGQVACYNFTMTNLSTGETSVCPGQLRAVQLWCLDLPIGVIDLPLATVASLNLHVTNTGDPDGHLDYLLREVPLVEGGAPSALRLNGLPPGTRYIGNFTLPPGGSTDVPVTVEIDDHEPFEAYTILLEADLDGDGEYEPLTSALVRSYTGCGSRPAGDVSGDGMVDVGDVPPFVSRLLSPDFDELDRGENFCAADLNADGKLNGRDTRLLVEVILAP